MIICCDFDCDTTLSVNNIEIKSDCGIFYLKGDIQQFIDSMLVNNFKLTEKVYSAFLSLLESMTIQELIIPHQTLYFGNYSISYINEQLIYPIN